MSSPDQIPVLLVEDNEDDLFFFKRLLGKAGIIAPVAVATDGQQAIDHLRRAIDNGSPQRAPLPRLVFLDLKLPLKGGFEVLQWIRTQPALARLVVVILSSSGEARDVSQAFSSGAQGYLVKYPESSVFVEVLRCVSEAPAGASVETLSIPGSLRPL